MTNRKASVVAGGRSNGRKVAGWELWLVTDNWSQLILRFAVLFVWVEPMAES